MEVVVGRLELDSPDRLDLVGPRRRDEVVEDRRPAGEALDPEQLLGVQAAVRRPVLGVALLRDAAVGDVVHEATGLLGEKASLMSGPWGGIGRSGLDLDRVHDRLKLGLMLRRCGRVARGLDRDADAIDVEDPEIPDIAGPRA